MSSVKKSNSLFIVLGDQLFDPEKAPFEKGDRIFMAEDDGLATHFKYHKHKIILFFSAMRAYAEELKKRGFEVTYLKCEENDFKKPFVEKLKKIVKKNSDIKLIKYYQISDFHFELEVKKAFNELKVHHLELANPQFLTSKEQFSEYLKGSKRPFMNTFYVQQRKRLNILMSKDNKPLFDQWSFDGENRKKYPAKITIPEQSKLPPSSLLEEVKKQVQKKYPDHLGSVEDYWIPYTRSQALKSVDYFINEKLPSFGPFQDAISPDVVFGFHSVISPMMNCGLITPDEVIERLLKKVKVKQDNISSIEGFIRQIIGWREFVKGIYDHYREQMENDNFWNHTRGLKDCWYNGSTGILPFDDSVKRLNRYGYTHHIDRLMVQSNLMLLCEIEPRQVYRWFMELYVDSADWVMAANVYGMGQMSEGGIFATKPYICGSNYLLKMSHYKMDDWCVTLDGLYWRFIEKHKKFFSKNPRLSMMVKTLDKIDKGRRKELSSRAEDFLKKNTIQLK